MKKKAKKEKVKPYTRKIGDKEFTFIGKGASPRILQKRLKLAIRLKTKVFGHFLASRLVFHYNLP